jgi:hypothetical protein
VRLYYAALEAFARRPIGRSLRLGKYCCRIGVAPTQFHTVQMQSQSLREIEDMSEANVANQKRILTNQATIIANQKQIKANQETIKKNQSVILKNQATLNTIVANQKKILSKLG